MVELQGGAAGRSGTADAVRSGDTGTWVDLLRPSDADAARVRQSTGLTLPTLEQLSEVEVSSRLRRDGDGIYLSLPVVFRDEAGQARITPVGFILSADHLVTVRFEELKSFHVCREKVAEGNHGHTSTVAIFVTLLEAIVDRLADILEETNGHLDKLSDEVFGGDLDEASGQNPKAQDARLRRILKRVGRDRQLISKVRATLLGIARIVPFVESEGEDWLPEDAKPRLEAVRRDVDSLDEFEVHLSDKVQFLLDADLGLINVEQNDRFRILTIVSVVGIPPTLVASMYGMNFKHMPELDWTYGYAYGLAVIALSAIVPIVYFRVKGWF